MLVLVVEDDRDLAELIIEFLEGEGIECDYAQNGLAALTLLEQNKYAILLLDINLPKMNGLAVCSTLRQRGVNIPCLMMTARDTLNDKLEGFDRGADDYLVKPFEFEELLARIKALSKRQINATQRLTIDDLQINLETHQAKRGNRVLNLSKNEWDLLVLLAQNSPNAVSKAQCEQHLYPDGAPSNNALKMLVYRLRQQIDFNHEAKILNTLRGFGFILK